LSTFLDTKYDLITSFDERIDGEEDLGDETAEFLGYVFKRADV
jgi:hypothetical protein